MPPVPPKLSRSDPGGTIQQPAAPTTAIVGIFIILLLAAIQYAREFLLPVVVALLLFFVFVPLQRRALRIGLPGSLTAAALVLGLLVGIASIFFLLSGPVMEVANNLPEIVRDLTARIEAARDVFLAIIQNFRAGAENDIPQLRPASAIEEATNGEEEEDDLLMNTLSGALLYLTETPAIVAQVIFALVLLFFLLSSSDLIYLKIIQSFDGFAGKRAALTALREVERNLGGYLGTVAVINAGLGVSIGLAMWALGMPVPLLFAVLAFLLNFIPYLGAVMGIILASLVALLWFDTLSSMLLVAGVYLLLTSIEGQLITPAFLARRLRMNTALVFLSVAFWAWMWSFLGMLIAVPILVALRVIAEQIPQWRIFANLLSGDPVRVIKGARKAD
ncbi:AI-2E family transporter [Roseinatronobacter bogoriensis]|uniref:AI-2E family transporter n=1 Tax=Roseinatronobacter bogoriensis TaxID=119542 RepID=UPI000ABEB8FD|nr:MULTISPECIES: AI-2E family transporter [Rhodobaca]MBB4208954.1 putative PurR-regulated permease PerM [Rhodobaca bogoriensis DSM 18756]TDW37621.1 putative PurR-regulated permease PerM [Rhodobaca barguzinensis]TDY68231.1 putative PurR-regulated permease PerM [Rhodobaca bogoriensis DSM 18756]